MHILDFMPFDRLLLRAAYSAGMGTAIVRTVYRPCIVAITMRANAPECSDKERAVDLDDIKGLEPIEV